MALTAGTVTVDNAGTPTGGGLARAMYDARAAAYEAQAADFYAANPEALVGIRRFIALESTATAAAIVAYVVANAEVSGGGIT